MKKSQNFDYFIVFDWFSGGLLFLMYRAYHLKCFIVANNAGILFFVTKFRKKYYEMVTIPSATARATHSTMLSSPNFPLMRSL